MLSSPGTLQIAKITRSAVCNSSLAPNKKRVVGGFCFIGDGVQTSQGLPDVFSLCSLWQKGKHNPLKQQVSDKNNSWRCFASLVTAANCHLQAGAERCAEHLLSPPASGQHRAARPWRGTCAVFCPDGLSGQSAPKLPSATAGVCNGLSRQLLKHLQECFRWRDRGFRVHSGVSGHSL